jgi:hypothetical protein
VCFLWLRIIGVLCSNTKHFLTFGWRRCCDHASPSGCREAHRAVLEELSDACSKQHEHASHHHHWQAS